MYFTAGLQSIILLNPLGPNDFDGGLKLKFKALGSHPHSPDLAPSDFHLFRLPKEALRSRRFASQTSEGSGLTRR
jgi:hypothetical protein